jgi:predicted MFS family arabinose efflux permease
MLVSLVLVAAAPNFAVLMAGRALLGICIGGFWALGHGRHHAARPGCDVPRALALMYGGQAIAAAFAAPLGSYLAGLLGLARRVLGLDAPSSPPTWSGT